MKELTCIVCPRGCTLCVSEERETLKVTGNHCVRGREFAIAEMTNPMRTVCSTVKTVFPNVPVLPVRTSAEVPKSRIFDVIKVINSTIIHHSTARGDVIIENLLGLGVDLIATGDC